MSPVSQRRFAAQFASEEPLLAATREARERGFSIDDVFTPYAVHGLDEAMGLAPSRLPWVCFGAGLTGLVSMLSFEIWTSAVSWRLNVGGKPFDSLPAFIPVAFEFTVLCAGLGSVAALLLRTKLWPGRAPAVLPGTTNDKFTLVVHARAESDETLRALFEHHGALACGPLQPDAPAPAAPPAIATVAP